MGKAPDGQEDSGSRRAKARVRSPANCDARLTKKQWSDAVQGKKKREQTKIKEKN